VDEQAAEAAMKSAVIALVAEQGVSGLTPDAICARATTPIEAFWARWPDANAALLETLDERTRLAELPDTGSLAEDLAAYAEAYLRQCADPGFAAFMFRLIGEAHADPAVRKVLAPGVVWRRARNRLMIERALARGEIAPETDGDAILDDVLTTCISWMGRGMSPTADDIRQRVAQAIQRGLPLPRRGLV